MGLKRILKSEEIKVSIASAVATLGIISLVAVIHPEPIPIKPYGTSTSWKTEDIDGDGDIDKIRVGTTIWDWQGQMPVRTGKEKYTIYEKGDPDFYFHLNEYDKFSRLFPRRK